MRKIQQSIIGIIAGIILVSFCELIVQAQTTDREETSYANLVVFVQFDDTDGNFMSSPEDVATIQKYYNDASYPKSLLSYVRSISYGQLRIDSYFPQLEDNTISPIILSKSRTEYIEAGNDYTVQKEALDLLNSEYATQLEKYSLDQDGDGFVDNITFIFQGDGGERHSLFYPKKEDYVGTETINGLRVGTINIQNSDAILGYGSIAKEGNICHEFLHSLGFPDLYKDGEISSTPVGRWDLMASASTFLQYPLSYLRSTEYLGNEGWLTIGEITPDNIPNGGELILVPASEKEGNQSYIIKSPLNTSECFVIEYRRQGDPYSGQLDAKIPGSGLIIYRINTKIERLSNLYDTKDGIYVFRQNEKSLVAGDMNSLNESFYSVECGRTEIGSLDLSAGISDGALVFSDGTNSGIKIWNIGNAGDTISCNVSFADYGAVELWNTLGNQNVSSDSSSVVSLDVDSTSQIYVAYDNADTNKLQISTYTEERGWVRVGEDITGYQQNGIIRIYNDIPYVAFSDSSSEMSMVLYEYSVAENKWNQIVTQNSISNGYIQFFTMETGKDGLYIAYEDGTFDGYTLKLGKYSEDGWQVVEDAIDTIQGSYPDIAVADDEMVYIGVREYENNKPIVYRVKEHEIARVGDLADIPCDSKVKIAVGNSGLYLLSDDSSGVRILQCDDYDNWVMVGNAPLTVKQSSTTDLAVMEGCPIVQLVNQEKDKENTQIFRYKDGMWSQEGNTIDTAVVTEAEMTLFQKKVYLSYLCRNGMEDFAVVKWKELDINEEDIPGGATMPTEIKVNKIELDLQSAKMKCGEELTLQVKVLPEEVKDKSVKWVSSDESIACVVDGVVTAKSVGDVVITVMTNDGGQVTAECKVTVERATAYAGEQYINGKYYHFNEETGEMTTGFCDLGHKIVYYGKTGEMLYGEQYIDGKYYHFEKWTGAMSVGLCDLGYKTVCYADKGEMLYGEQLVNGKYYYFEKWTGAMHTGFCQLDEKKVFYSDTGEMVYGEQYIGGKYYYFDILDGSMAIGFCDLGYKMVYYGPDGIMRYGFQNINDNIYYFHKWTGEMMRGEQYIDGKYYHFNEKDGRMSVGFCDLKYKIVYYGTDGAMRYNQQYIKRKYYHFNPWTGEMTVGWCDLPGKRVYYGTDGAMLYGKQTIDGRVYYFNTMTGALQ